jgi:hypothetical protein
MTVAVLKAVVVLVSTVSVSEVVDAHGAVSGAPFIVVLLLLLVSVAAILRLGSFTGDTCPARRVMWLALTPVGGFAMLATLLVMQLRRLGTSSYYFLKLFVGFELILAVLAAVAVAVLVAFTAPGLRSGTRAIGALLMSALMTQSLGHVSWSTAPMLHPLVHGSDMRGNALDLGAVAKGILAAADAKPSGSYNDLQYVAIGPAHGVDGVLPAAWHHALTGTLSYRAHERMSLLNGTFGEVEQAVPYVRRVLATDPGTSVLVDSAFVSKLRSLLGPELAPRVLGVSSMPSD